MVVGWPEIRRYRARWQNEGMSTTCMAFGFTCRHAHHYVQDCRDGTLHHRSWDGSHPDLPESGEHGIHSCYRCLLPWGVGFGDAGMSHRTYVYRIRTVRHTTGCIAWVPYGCRRWWLTCSAPSPYHLFSGARLAAMYCRFGVASHHVGVREGRVAALYLASATTLTLRSLCGRHWFW